MDKNQISARLKEIQQLRNKYDLTITPAKPKPGNETLKLEKGISVIIPTYKGEKVILNCLNSLRNQTLDQELFEVIFILNGERDSTESIIKNFIQRTNMKNVTILDSSVASASISRNIGIQYALREYTTFVDDDDYLSDNYLETMYQYADANSVVVSQIANDDGKGNIDDQNSINQQIIKAAKNESNDFSTLNMAATINACKLIPTRCVKNVKYDSALRSGEDVVFFMDLFVNHILNFKVIPIEKKAVYYRIMRDNSVSRQAMTFDFYVKQRLDVIQSLNDLLSKSVAPKQSTFIKQKINAQSMFINRYLKENMDDRDNVISAVKSRNLSYIPYSLINKGLSQKLVISFCFPPYVDTAANVMAKRIRNANEVVDVVYNQMDRVRPKDNNVSHLVNDLIDERMEIPSYPSFSNWKAIRDFCSLGMEKINKEKNYKEIYSRAMWPGSHFLAYEYKRENPEVKWVAEFSDPLILDIQGKVRESKIDDPAFIKKANKAVKRKYGFQPVKDDNLFFWCEYLPYIFADELVFTNENQMQYMMDTFPIDKVKEIIKRKAVISSHPTVSREYYNIKECSYQVDENKVNFAYFGTFYKTRNLDDLFVGLENVNAQDRKHIHLHIFTANPEALKDDLKGSEIEDLIQVNPYVSYTEFLNLTTRFDCLVVNDANTKDYKPINPYLPSKLSDYLGSGNKIWGIYEQGSVLSRYSLAYKSELGNINQATEVFEKAVEEKNILQPV
ncbi:glycosyltransferase [Halobacillus yeomjeoni]|uniref:Glycosyltransferase n=1 Tax=Halobacillus yeomjeoni TaxID=311194 RepID=A0A931HVU5_9BACI|nr:glycosyltransferase [Halobacillus yeomjeoni]MBH0230732.1 glycosyltransferase [Halobacillus yeomjeoni]